jgi:hypothetical protein
MMSSVLVGLHVRLGRNLVPVLYASVIMPASLLLFGQENRYDAHTVDDANLYIELHGLLAPTSIARYLLLAL